MPQTSNVALWLVNIYSQDSNSKVALTREETFGNLLSQSHADLRVHRVPDRPRFGRAPSAEGKMPGECALALLVAKGRAAYTRGRSHCSSKL